MNIGTRVPSSTFRTPTPASIKACSKGQAATEQESDEIVAPEVTDFFPLLDQLASAVDAVAR